MAENLKAHRPVITGSHAMVSTGHSLASCEALYVLKKGGNAMDAALAAAAVLAVVKSYHCGLGGDVFALYFSAREQKLNCLNGSGKVSLSAQARTLCKGNSRAGGARGKRTGSSRRVGTTGKQICHP